MARKRPLSGTKVFYAWMEQHLLYVCHNKPEWKPTDTQYPWNAAGLTSICAEAFSVVFGLLPENPAVMLEIDVKRGLITWHYRGRRATVAELKRLQREARQAAVDYLHTRQR